MAYRNMNPRTIKARFDSICPETGKAIKAGDECVYFPRAKKAYHMDSNTAGHWRSQQFADSAGLLDANW